MSRSILIFQVSSGIALPTLLLPPDASHCAPLVPPDASHCTAEIDFDVQLTSVGVEKFILIRAETGLPVVRLSVPSASLQLRVCELGTVDELPVSCIMVPAAADSSGSRPPSPAAAKIAAPSSDSPSHSDGASSAGSPTGRRASAVTGRAPVQFQVMMRSPVGNRGNSEGGR